MIPWMGAAQMGMGAIQTAISAAQMANLPDRQKYSATDELKDATSMARKMAENGMSPEERAARENMVERRSNAAYRKALDVAPGSAQAALAGIESARLAAANDMAMENASIKRSGMGLFSSLAGQMQSISDRNVADQNAYRDRSEQALGQAVQTGIGNMFGGLGGINKDLQYKELMDGLSAGKKEQGAKAAGGALLKLFGGG